MKLNEILVSKLHPRWSAFGCPQCGPKSDDGYFLIELDAFTGELIYLCPNCLKIYEVDELAEDNP